MISRQHAELSRQYQKVGEPDRKPPVPDQQCWAGPGVGLFSFGTSATGASVVIRSDATEAASWSAERKLGRVDHACLDKVLISAGGRVEASIIVLGFDQLAEDPGTVLTGILGDLPGRREARGGRCQSQTAGRRWPP